MAKQKTYAQKVRTAKATGLAAQGRIELAREMAGRIDEVKEEARRDGYAEAIRDASFQVNLASSLGDARHRVANLAGMAAAPEPETAPT